MLKEDAVQCTSVGPTLNPQSLIYNKILVTLSL